MYKYADPMLYGVLKEFARENRKNQTEAESVLWHYIKDKALGVKFLRQHIIADCIADFACTDFKLIIEVDGGYHSEVNQIYNDLQRIEKLNRLGFEVIRFKNEEVLFDIENTLNKIKTHLIKSQPLH